MNTLIALSALVVVALACDQPDLPKPKFSSCSDDAVLDIDFDSAVISPYPIKKGDDTQLTFKYNNKGPAVSKPKVDITAHHFGGLFGCSYHHIIPDMNGQDACTVFGDCPLKAGENTHNGPLKIPMIDTALTLYGTGKAYQIQMKVKDESGKVLGCMVTEAMTA